MTGQEMSNEFDVLYNNITSNQAPGLNDYEKSLFLTKAQDEIVKAYFDPLSNKIGAGVDGNRVGGERRQVDFSSILQLEELNTFGWVYKDSDAMYLYPSSDGREVMVLPDDMMMLLNNFITVKRTISEDNTKEVHLSALTITYADLQTMMMKPYKRPHQYQAWVINNDQESSHCIEVIVGPKDEIMTVMIRYVKKPSPIIISSLEGEDVSIEGETNAMDCRLDPILHEEIVQRAVELAKMVYTGEGAGLINSGQLSGTAIGTPGTPPPGGRGE